MENQRLELDRQEAILFANEIVRQGEDLQEQCPEALELNRPEFGELERGWQDLRAGKNTGEQFRKRMDSLCTNADDQIDARVEELKQQGEVESVMSRRAAKEAEMKGMSGFLQALVDDAFAWAGRGSLESEWRLRVFER